MLWTIFFTFFKVGLFTIGGGYAMMPVIQDAFVSKCWMTDDECLDAFAIINGLPGPIVVNLATFMGYKMKGVPGAFMAAAGAVMPSMMVILVLASLFSSIMDQQYVQYFFAGARPAVCALLLYSMVKLGQAAQLGVWYNAVLAIAALAAVGLLGLHHIFVILGGAFIGIIVCFYNNKKGGDKNESSSS